MRLENKKLSPKEDRNEYYKWIQNILENNPKGAFILKSVQDQTGKIVNFKFSFVNKKSENLLNTTQLTEKYFIQIFPESIKTGLFPKLVEVAEREKPLYEKVILKRKQNDFHLWLSAVKIENGCLVTISPEDNIDDNELTENDLTDKGTSQPEDSVSKKMLTSILNAFPLAVLITDETGGIYFRNTAATQGFIKAGIEFTSVKDLNKLDGKWPGNNHILKPEEWPIARALYKGETTIEEEIEIIKPDGSRILFLHYAAPIINENKIITGSVGIVKDITEIRQAEIKVRIAEDKQAFLLKLSDKLHYTGNPQNIQSEAVTTLGEHLRANRAGYIEDNGDGKSVKIICNYLNGADDIRGTYWYDDYGAEVLNELREGKTVLIDDVRNSSLPAANVTRLNAKGMAYKPLLKNGMLSAILFVHYTEKHTWTNEEKDLIEETAERVWTAVEWARTENKLRNTESKYLIKLEKEVKKRTAELKESKHFVQLLTDTTPDIMFVYDIRKWKIIYVNKEITNALQYTPQEVYGYSRKDFESLLHPDDLLKRINEMARMVNLKPGEVRESNFRIFAKNGKGHWLNVRDVFFKEGKDGSTSQVLSICRDITERIEAIEAYRKEKNRSDELKRINELMDTFVFAAAHDLKAPVSNLKTLTHVINSINDNEKKLDLQKKYEEIVETLDLTISGLVKVLAVEKDSSSGTKDLNFQNVFNKVTEEMKEELEVVNPVITTDFTLCKSIRYIESYLFSIFRNLMSNSLKFRKANNTLTVDIQTGCKENYVWLTFSDNGIGINLEKYGADLFKPFKRFSNQTKGSGLGLNLIKTIVTKNGGYIDVSSTKSEGTTFTVFMVPYN